MQKAQQIQDWQSTDQKYLWHSMRGSAPSPSNLIITKSEGVWITDIDGKKYLDGMSGLWCVNVGYGRQELAQAAYEQLQEMPYYPLSQSHLPAIKLAEKINEWLDGDYLIFFSNSGSEANEAAFKMARQYHHQTGQSGRYKFISRYRAYHGSTLGALAATGQAQRKYKYEPLAPGFIHVTSPDLYRRPDDVETLDSALEIDNVMTAELSETIAGVIMEPIITGGGILMPPDNYMQKVKEICEKHGALLLCDEVICGFGRTGKPFGYMNYGVKPDIITMAKGLTSGYLPLSATAVKREIYDAYAGNGQYDHFRHVNTFGGNPAACALALKNMEIIENENLIERSKVLGERLIEQLEALKTHPYVGDIRGKGLLVGIELVRNKDFKEPIELNKINRVIASCKEKGLIVGKNGDTVAGYNNVLQLAPPLIITEKELAFIVDTVTECLNELQ
ncbi:aspartate aminotransferase family protein [Bacillus sp. T33-2]|uniref:aspartate aminotransferase family protein n=1 Tax=Bacillus sp. T33-2 TaxID=2054168 RepID=UPI000C7946B7|nr:aspartate aminotransferase family protein [Bacillus sp. T33-2]PLR92031.1 aspartate aminotransferase family protein [Bacillus sp. T33-2]